MFGNEIHDEFCKKYNIDKLKLIEDIILSNKTIFKKPLSQFEECIAIDLINELGYSIFGVSLNISDFKVITDKDTIISYEGPVCYISDNAFNNYYS
jgi:hypothetical protein